MELSIYNFYRRMAMVGIVLLVGIALISVISITGRALIGIGLKPVPGDFELVEIGSALAVFCFLPWTHLSRSHAVVDIMWTVLPQRIKPVLIALTDLLMLLVWVLLIWRMGVATLDYRENGETSFILLLPVWYGYALAMLAGVIGLFAYLWKALESCGFVAIPPEYNVDPVGGH